MRSNSVDIQNDGHDKEGTPTFRDNCHFRKMDILFLCISLSAMATGTAAIVLFTVYVPKNQVIQPPCLNNAPVQTLRDATMETEKTLLSAINKLRFDTENGNFAAMKNLQKSIHKLRIDIENTTSADRAAREAMEDIATNNSSVAFTASVTEGYIYNNINNGATIKFETVMTNIGEGYNNSSGMFTAPLDGVYFFSVTIRVFNVNAHVSLMKESMTIGHVYPVDYNIRSHASESVSAVTELTKGENVFVQFNYGSRNNGYSIYNNDYCIFTGMLLR